MIAVTKKPALNFVGRSGCGKTYTAKAVRLHSGLSQDQFPIIDTSDVLKARALLDDDVGRTVAADMKATRIVDPELTNLLLAEAYMDALRKPEVVIVGMVGWPRSIEQVEAADLIIGLFSVIQSVLCDRPARVCVDWSLKGDDRKNRLDFEGGVQLAWDKQERFEQLEMPALELFTERTGVPAFRWGLRDKTHLCPNIMDYILSQITRVPVLA